MQRMFPMVLAIALAGCGAPTATPLRSSRPFEPIKLPETAGLHNLIAVNDWLSTGGEPKGDAGFRSLASLGCRTVITVDGARPDVALAETYGLRYVHLPVGYNALPRERVLQIAKAMSALPRPIYLHCHHGKHRGPAAAAAALRCLDPSWSTDTTSRYLKYAGTDPQYAELIASAESQTPVGPAELERVPAEFPAVADVSDLTARMVEIDAILRRLKASRTTTNKVVNHDAVLLREQYGELLRDSDARPEGFRELLRMGEIHADQMANPQTPGAEANGISMSERCCTDCHRTYRNAVVPK